MGSCCPNDSRALGVLVAFQREIRAFVSVSDQRQLSAASWWLFHSAASSRVREDAQWPTEDELNALTKRLHQRLTTGGRKRLKVDQVRVLLRNLVLVASGLRPSCLVDCCALTKEQTQLLLQSFERESLQRFALDQVRAVLLDGNVFFVNADAFVREKMATLQMFVDVTANLAQPQVICSSSRLQSFSNWTLDACKQLLEAESCCVLQWKRPVTLHATALAGILLCYPCVYDMLADGTDDDGWSVQENCLALCPLVLVRTSLRTSQLEIALHEFSTPQHLLLSFNEHRQIATNLHLQKHLQARCRLELQRAIERSGFCSSFQPKVHVETRSLARVAL